jgi:phosphate transport system permease protein
MNKVTRPSRAGDRIFSALVTGAGVLILAILAGVAIFLLVRGWPALTAKADELPDGQTFLHYVWPLAFGTILSSTIAIIIAVPLAVGVALFISFFAPRRLANLLGAVLGPAAVGLQEWLYAHLDFLPFFKGPPSPTGRTMFVLGIVLAVMILPIISAIVREVFAQTPRSLREGSLALGATRWEMIRMTVLPFGRPAIISASMLGLGRALGETMAVALILSVSGGVTVNLISSGNPSTIAANIALNFPESSGLAINLLIATGLVLFGITLLVNTAARLIIGRQIRE